MFTCFSSVPAVGLVAAYAIWIGYPIAITAACFLLVAALLQLYALRAVMQHTTSLQRRVPGEMRLLILSFLLFVVLLLQLCLTPIIGGNANCDCAWDQYSKGVQAIQGIGSGLSAISAVIGLVFIFGAFLNNTDHFSVCLFHVPIVSTSFACTSMFEFVSLHQSHKKFHLEE